MRKNRGRRAFLQAGLAGLAGVALLPRRGLWAGARPAGARRAHLINIVVFGGWDSNFHMNGVQRSEWTGHLHAPGSIIGNNGQFLKVPGNNGFHTVLDPVDRAEVSDPLTQAHQKLPDTYLRQHPEFGAVVQLGPILDPFSDTDLNRVAICRGIRSEGGHFIGNRLIQTGTLGDQTASYPAIIAQALASDYVRDLHYVQITADPQKLYNQIGPLVGSAEPVVVSSMEDWKQLTEAGADELSADRSVFIDQGVERLTGLAKASFRKPASRDSVQGFIESFRGMLALQKSNYAKLSEFGATLESYKTALSAAVNASQLRLLFPQRAWVGTSDTIDVLAFRFALAEFLVVKDKAAVVDLQGMEMDMHTHLVDELYYNTLHFAAYRHLITRLAATEGDGGKTMLDATMIVMHTEFDRTPTYARFLGDPRYPGTDHWDYQTGMLLAGHGVNGGSVVGEFSRGVNSAFFPRSTFNVDGIYRPLPINFATGRPDVNGKIPATRNLFPTILSAFGASGLSALSDGAGPIQALLKR